MQTVLSVVTPTFLVILALAGGYVFKERADRQEAKLETVTDQLNALTVKIAAMPDRGEFTGQFERVESRFERVESRFERVESQLASLRADLTQIALAVGARTRPQTG